MHSFVGADGEYELPVRGCIILHVVGTFRSFSRRAYVNTLTAALARKVPQHAIRSFWGVLGLVLVGVLDYSRAYPADEDSQGSISIDLELIAFPPFCRAIAALPGLQNAVGIYHSVRIIVLFPTWLSLFFAHTENCTYFTRFLCCVDRSKCFRLSLPADSIPGAASDV